MACRLPGHATSPHKLWEFLQAGGIAVSDTVPGSRYNGAGHFDGSGKPGTMKALGGMYIEDIDPAEFDAPFFSISRADAVAMDPQQRQLLEVVYECLENGGITLEKISGEEIGCYVGSYSAGKLSAAIVAGVNLWMSPEHLQETGTLRAAYSATGRCHTFDAKADGYCRAEAVNAVFLKRLSDAVRDGDPIRAVIRGTANNSDGRTPGINSPSSEAQAAVTRAAYADAGLGPGLGLDSHPQYTETGYLECHGTGTPAGDPLEVKGAASVLCQGRTSSEPLIIGSLKSNIGHSEPGAGISGLIKATMAVESGTIPGNPTFVTPNPNIDFEGLRVRPTRWNMPWPKASNKYRRASVNSFGYGGSNAHAVLDNTEHFLQHRQNQDQHHTSTQKGPSPYVSSYVKTADLLQSLVNAAGTNAKPFPSPIRKPQVLVFSANDEDSLRRQIEAISTHLLDPRVSIDLADLSHTLSERRSRHFFRASVLARPTLNGKAGSISMDAVRYAKRPQGAARIGFVFTGQGAQWSQMGADLIRTFPETAGAMVKELDAVLQGLPAEARPAWTLLEELTTPRTVEHLRKPEFSQPLVTALQLCLATLLDSWGVRAEVVVGHSSGEIAAACVAGLITPAQAILAAYFRGYAAAADDDDDADAAGTGTTEELGGRKGMMAVGLGAEKVRPYLDATTPAKGSDSGTGSTLNKEVFIACYNSPSSVTLSGPVALLADLAETIKANGHFARMLQVDLAYHSRHMSDIARRYEGLLQTHGLFGHGDDFDGSRGANVSSDAAVVSSKPVMVSSVNEAPVYGTGAKACGAAYWKANMVSPVRFAGACKRALTDTNEHPAATCLIEIGPSNALSGPVGQVIKEAVAERVIRDDLAITYMSAAKRGQDGASCLVDLAAQLFLLDDTAVSLRNVNSDETAGADGCPSRREPAVIVDLPNYKWNHSMRYWHESLASRDWRFRRFPEHDLLGSKVPGTLWKSPSWHKTLRLSDAPWLRDHRIGTEILFPAAGYIAMAVEAVRQTVLSTTGDTAQGPESDPDQHYYTLRDVRFTRAMVLHDDADMSVMLSLAPMTKLGADWWEYRVMSSQAASDPTSSSSSSSSDAWTENSRGLIRLELGAAITTPRSALGGPCDLTLRDASPARLWYKAMSDAGYGYGPDFQKQTYVESRQGKASSRSLVSLEPPRSKWEPQSQYYPMHPAPMDGCLQSVFTSLHRGNRSSFDEVLLPAGIDSIVASSRPYISGNAVSVTASRFMLVGNPDESRKPLSDASVYDAATGALILQLEGVSFLPMDVGNSVYVSHTYARVEWKPDFTQLDTGEKLDKALSAHVGGVQELLDLAAHKNPNLSVLELNLDHDGDTADSLWLREDKGDSRQKSAPRAAVGEFHYASDSADVVLASRELYFESQSLVARNAHFTLIDPFSQLFSPPAKLPPFNLVLVRMPHRTSAQTEPQRLERLAESTRRLLADGGSVIFYGGPRDNDDDGDCLIEALVRSQQFTKIRRAVSGTLVAEAEPAAATHHHHHVDGDNDDRQPDNGQVVLLRLCSDADPVISAAAAGLEKKGWTLTEIRLQPGIGLDQEQHILDQQLRSKSTVLVLDEIIRPVLATATEDQWKAIQTVVHQQCNLLWVTQGSQMAITDPLKSVCHGVFRTVRAEEPLLRLFTLDVESSTMEGVTTIVGAVDSRLRELTSAPAGATATNRLPPAECEFAERGGLLYVSRVWPDDGVNRLKAEDAPGGGPEPVMVDLHASRATIRMAAERLGTLDSLQFYEVGDGEPEKLRPDEVEIELFASSCNYKEVAVTMGIVPEDQRRLGSDGAGIIVRVGDSAAAAANNRHVGQRVAVHRSGCFGNRVAASHRLTFPIPDAMSFEEGATLPVVFGTAIYGLHHLANLQRGQRVLIHSAAGGVGIACVQLCQRLGCDVFATVGGPDKRAFLKDEFGIPDDHIFSSRSSVFARGIREATRGYGVDVVVNSLVGNLLDHSWRLLAPQGTLLQIAKKDSLDHNWLSMEPFVLNCSVRSLDISILPLETLGRIYTELAELVSHGHIQPVSPRRVWGYNEIPKALKLLRAGNHIGKFVISNGPDAKVMVSVRPARRQASSLLDSDHTYLIVGGLKGVCGSLAIHLARQGAKHLSIMSRSGCQDRVSQSVVRDLEALGCSVDLLQGDVSVAEDVKRCFENTPVPIGGIIQGAAVFRDRTFESMTHADYIAALSCKVQGTWNLHTIASETRQPIRFFTMLSSTSGLVGQKGQANYAGGNVFMDALAAYRRALGLPAISINLGPVEDVGVIQGNENLEGRFDRATWFGINEGLLRRIVDYSILQQHPDPDRRPNLASQAQMVTGIVVPQPRDSELVLRDVRFAGLGAGRDDENDTGSSTAAGAAASGDGDKTLDAFFLLARSNDPDRTAVLSAAVVAVGAQFARQLGLGEAMDPARPLSVYGMDSLAAVEFRNWVRMTFGAELTTLDVMNAASLMALCDKVVAKMGINITTAK
ncbi:hypothetical protein LZ30DRAFT_785922 [Colletotrichum cereale]|nr:hypothetical protein LZ30DRAFT_785922 [Colletotrichum cereale]